MTIRLGFLLLVILGFGAFTAKVLWEVGFWGILEPHFRNWGPAQVFTDLVIMALVACGLIVEDARRRGVAAWPYVALTLVAGSFGPLIYLVKREMGNRRKLG